MSLFLLFDPYLEFLNVKLTNFTSPSVILNALPVTVIAALFSATTVKL